MKIMVAALMLSTGAAIAAPADCIRVETDLDRLACYDKEAGRTPAVEQLPATAGKWLRHKEKSQLTDQETVILSVRSDETINCGWNRGDTIGLVMRCMDNTTSLFFTTGCHMADHGGYDEIVYRLDSDKAQTIRGETSTDNKSIGHWTGGKAIPMMKQMVGKSKMVVRMTPFSENPFTATFDISGLGEALQPLRESCKW
jgi:type VI secretion system protein VasI